MSQANLPPVDTNAPTWRGALKTIETDAAAGEKIGGKAVEKINGAVSSVIGSTAAQLSPSGKIGAAIARAEGAMIGGAVGIVDAAGLYMGKALGLVTEQPPTTDLSALTRVPIANKLLKSSPQ